jgi:hypothetical protein
VLRSLRPSALVLATLAACESATAPGSRINSVQLAAVDTVLEIGQSRQLILTALSASGAVTEAGTVSWQSQNPTVATVSPGGMVLGLSVGTATIVAEAGGKSASVRFAVTPPICTAARATAPALSIGASRSGTVTAASCLLGGQSAIGHPVTITGDGWYQAEVTGVGGAPTLVLTNTMMHYVGGGGAWNASNAGMRAQLAPGTYLLWVMAAYPALTTTSMNYTLTMNPAAGACGTGSSGPVAIGDLREAVISRQSCQLLYGPYMEGWTLTLVAPTRLRIQGSSTAFAPTFAITEGEDEVVNWVEGAPNTTVTLTTELAAGTYRVWAGSFYAATGTVQMTLSEAPPCPSPIVITLPDTLAGTLTAGDDCGFGGQIGKRHRLTLGAPTEVQIDQRSSAFDSFLIVTLTDGTVVTYDDDGGLDLDSRIVTTLPAGEYDLWVGSFSGASLGAYSLSVIAASPDGLSARRAPGAPKSPGGPWPRPRSPETRRTGWPPSPSSPR